MRTIAIMNQKGGCGKTTTAINLAATLAARGHRTLLVDMDPQGHCALGLAVPEAQVERQVGDLLRAGLDGSLAVSEVTWQITRRLDLVPATMALAALERTLATATDRDRRLVQVLATVQDTYEFTIVDCGPSIGLLAFNALRAADEVVIPVETGYFALKGANKQAQTVEMLARRAGHHARLSVLATMYDARTRLAREILEELSNRFGEQLLPVVINYHAKLREAASFGQPITEYDAASKGMQDFDLLADWLLDNPPGPPPMSPEFAGPATATAGPSRNPALSRAAELVERARSLAQRTATVSANLAGQNTPTPPDADRPAPIEPDEIATQVAAEHPEPGPQEAVAEAQATDKNDETVYDHPALAADADTPVEESGEAPAACPVRIAPRARVEEPLPPPPGPVTRLPLPPLRGQSPVVPAESDTPTTAPSPLQRLYGARSTRQGLLFVQPADAGRRLAIAGDFNGWSPDRTPMLRDETTGAWRAVVTANPGRYRYRLVIDGRWQPDPHNPDVEANPFGEPNNVVELDEQPAADLAQPAGSPTAAETHTA
ncbi:MAG: AAA family ATPase [Planctomycetota bacterium]